jgi:hypothetical protein
VVPGGRETIFIFIITISLIISTTTTTITITAITITVTIISTLTITIFTLVIARQCIALSVFVMCYLFNPAACYLISSQVFI